MKQDPVKAKIIELVPEIVELKFGCRLKVKDTNGKKHVVTFASDADYAGLVWDNGDTGSYVEDWVLEILGCPITLEHVLKAIHADPRVREFQWEVVAQAQECMDLVGKWNLCKPYDDQSEETKAFIGKILGV